MPAPTPIAMHATSLSTSGRGDWAPGAVSSGYRHGTHRPRRLVSATRPGPSSSSTQTGPGRQALLQPWRSVSTQTPIGRSTDGASGRGVSEPSGRATNREGPTSSGASSASVPTRASQRPSGDGVADSTSPRSRTISDGSAGVPDVGTRWTDGRGNRSAPSCRAAQNTSDRPSGSQAGLDTSKSPLVSWRLLPPGRAVVTNRCVRRSRTPSSSARHPPAAIRRAVGDAPCRGASTRNRAGPAGPQNAISFPSGDHAKPRTPWRASVTRRGSPPSRGSTHTWAGASTAGAGSGACLRWRGDVAAAASSDSSWCRGSSSRTLPSGRADRNARRVASGENRGCVSLGSPGVSWRTRPRRRGTSHNARRYPIPATVLRTTTAVPPSGATSSSSRTTWRRTTSGVTGERRRSMRWTDPCQCRYGSPG